LIKFCKHCLTLNTIGFNPIKEDICQACINYEDQNKVNWHSRLKELYKIFEQKKSNNFDCIVPVSGGKDSTFQIFKFRSL
jgi:muramoyltetrapeptide carboxypeptidase LdcA involved in peptidoglycan recycling